MINIMVTKYTTIKVTKDFRDWLELKGKKGETFQELIKRLIIKRSKK